MKRKLEISKNEAEILTAVEQSSKFDRSLTEKLGFREPIALSAENF
ncbi:hypothetical protein IQ269_16810 [Tychonema sp. LEGE 07199]|nr:MULTISPECIES: hypothetical protein [unclassified Tychonema]MBE9122414.1 hypothetical protein [Tychonema sp. LEGE 07199]MBE9134821.1 hypothetical protein [Tychonema sp. LEGE 07196]